MRVIVAIAIMIAILFAIVISGDSDSETTLRNDGNPPNAAEEKVVSRNSPRKDGESTLTTNAQTASSGESSIGINKSNGVTLFLKSEENSEPISGVQVRLILGDSKGGLVSISDENGHVQFDRVYTEGWIAYLPTEGIVVTRSEADEWVENDIAGWLIRVRNVRTVEFRCFREGEPVGGAKILRERPGFGPAVALGITDSNGLLVNRGYRPFDRYYAVHDQYVCVATPKKIQRSAERCEIHFELVKSAGSRAHFQFQDSKGVPISGVELELVCRRGRARFSSGIAKVGLFDRGDLDGLWSSPFLLPSVYEVFAKTDKGLKGRFVFEVIGPQDVNEIMILSKGLVLRGEFSRKDKTPLRGAFVQLRHSSGYLMDTAQVQPSGRYELSGIERNSVHMVVAAAKGCKKEKIEVEFQETDRTLDFKVSPEKPLGSILVASTDGKGIPNLRVYLFKGENRQPTLSRISNIEGRVVLSGISVGKYRIEVAQAASKNGDGVVLDVREISLPAPEEIVIQIPESRLPSAWLRGQLGESILALPEEQRSSISLQLSRPGGKSQILHRVVALPDGSFRIGPFVAGDYSALVVVNRRIISLPSIRLRPNADYELGAIEIPQKVQVLIEFETTELDGEMITVELNGSLLWGEIKQPGSNTLRPPKMALGSNIRVKYKDANGSSKVVEDVIRKDLIIRING